MRGVSYADINLLFGGKFDKINLTMQYTDRSKVLELVRDMSNEGAIADKALDKLCEDATSNEVKIDAPSRRKRIIKDLLDRVGYQGIRKDLLYMFLRDGDRFIQLEYVRSTELDRAAMITRVMDMPVITMIRNTNERDDFDDPERAFYQVDDIKNGLSGQIIAVFPWAKMIHARNDCAKSMFFGYGRSTWYSAVKIFNMFMMEIEDSAIMRHTNSQNLRVHYVGKDSPGSVKSGAIQEYMQFYKEQVDSRSTDVFVGGGNEINMVGGTKNVMSSVDDIMLVFSILSIAVDYPLDLLSGMISRSSGGEELFRKEAVLKRAVKSIIKKENLNILRPLIDRELIIAGNYGPYRITTYPSSFEDESKRSKRGIGEVQALLKSPQTYHMENNEVTTWEEEQAKMEEAAKFYQELHDEYPDGVSILGKAAGRKTVLSGNQGDSRDVVDQEDESTPGSGGSEDRDQQVGGGSK
jgi:hypothetical protein